jgi:hypothetical protein
VNIPSAIQKFLVLDSSNTVTQDANEIVYTFSYGDATPQTLYAFTNNGIVNSVELRIATPFNGTSPSITIGDNSVSDSLMSAGQNLPKTAGTYQTNPLKQYSSGAYLLFTLVPGSGCSQGSGEIIINF